MTTTRPPESGSETPRDPSGADAPAAAEEGRDTRQRGLVPPDELARTHAVVVGVGAIGRQVALQLAAMGLPRLTLVDFDLVEPVNLGPQGWLEADLGQPKVNAAADLCQQINPKLETREIAEKFRRSRVEEYCAWPERADARCVVFACVDSMEARSLVWKATWDRTNLLVDGRMAGENMRVLVVHNMESFDHYGTTLFTDEEAHQGACTARSTIYTSNIVAGLMVQQMAMWLRGQPPVTDQSLSLRTSELTVTKD